MAPVYGAYTFYVTGSGTGLEIDGRAMLAVDPQADTQRSVNVVLAKGLHDVKLTGTMDNALSRVDLLWAGQNGDPIVIDTRFLYVGPSGTSGGLSGEVVAGYNSTALSSTDPLGDKARIQRRSDPFIGFREATTSFGQAPITARWQGTLVISRAGPYAFDTLSSGPSLVFIDGTLVVDNSATGSASGAVELSAGAHDVDLRYTWQSGPARWEWFWTPPGGEHALVPTNVLLPAARSWLASELTDTPVALLTGGQGPDGEVVSGRVPDAVLGADIGLLSSRGLGVDGQGNVYIGDRGNHRIVVIAAGGALAASWGKAPEAGHEITPSAGEFNDIVDVAVDKSGSVYVMDTGANQLQVFSPRGTLVRTVKPRNTGGERS